MHYNQAKTHCPQGHPYEGENLRLEPGLVSPRRLCRICARERTRVWRAKNKAHRANYMREKRRKDPLEAHKHRVWARVSDAIRKGKIKRQPCEVCGAHAEAHHDDYDKPFDVRWLCPTHHRELHQQRKEAEA